MRWSLVVLLATVMSEGSTSADAASNTTAARRDDRWSDAVQPEAVEYPSQAASQRWVAKIKATQPAGGKNKKRKDSGLTPCKAATKEAAEAARDQKLHAWLHAWLQALLRNTLGA